MISNSTPLPIKFFCWETAIETTCNGYNLHRNASYKFLTRYVKRKIAKKKEIYRIKEDHIIQPQAGHKKRHKPLIKQGLKVNTSQFFGILRINYMLVKRKKSSCKTTDSHPRF